PCTTREKFKKQLQAVAIRLNGMRAQAPLLFQVVSEVGLGQGKKPIAARLAHGGPVCLKRCSKRRLTACINSGVVCKYTSVHRRVVWPMYALSHGSWAFKSIRFRYQAPKRPLANACRRSVGRGPLYPRGGFIPSSRQRSARTFLARSYPSGFPLRSSSRCPASGLQRAHVLRLCRYLSSFSAKS